MRLPEGRVFCKPGNAILGGAFGCLLDYGIWLPCTIDCGCVGRTLSSIDQQAIALAIASASLAVTRAAASLIRDWSILFIDRPASCGPAGCKQRAQWPWAIYNCPYFLRTARHPSPTRQLCAASMVPHRSRLLMVMPPLRSQYLAAAGRHGASSARSIAFADVTKRPRNKSVTSASFIGMSLTHMNAPLDLLVPGNACVRESSSQTRTLSLWRR
jgi:hypothetical protein